MWTAESAAQALRTASADRWDGLLGDAAFLVHLDPDVLTSVVPLTYRPIPGAAGQTLEVYRTVAHRLADLDPAGRAQVLSVQAIRFGVEDRFAAAVEPGMWSGVWASGGSAPRGLLAQLRQPRGEAVAVGRSDGRQLAVVGDGGDGALRVWDLAHGVQLGRPLAGHDAYQEGAVRAVALLPGAGSPTAVSAGFDGTVRCWDLLGGRQLGDVLDTREDTGARVRTMVAATVDGAPVVVIGADDGLQVWGRPGRWERRGRMLPHPSRVLALAVAEVDGVPVALTGCADGALRLWDLARCEAAGTPLRGHVGSIDAITTVELAGRPVALTAGADATVRVWDLHDRRAIGCIPLDGAARVDLLAACPGRSGYEVLVSAGTVARFVLPHAYPAGGGTIVATPTLLRATYVAMAAVDGCRMAVTVGGPDATTQLWDLDAATTPEATGHRDEVAAVVPARIAGVPVLLTGGTDGTVRAWDRDTGTPTGRPLEAGTGRAVNDLAVVEFSGRDLLVTCHGQPDVRIWDLAAGHLLAELDTDCDWVLGVDIVHLDHRPVVVSTGGYRTQFWELASAREWDTRFDSDGVYSHAVAAGRIDGHPVAVTTASAGKLTVWDCADGRTFPLAGHRLDVNAVVTGEFAGVPVALTSASHGTTGDVRLWDLNGRRCLVQFEAGHHVRALALSRVGTRTLAFTGGDDGTVRAWDCSSGRRVATLYLPETVTALAWDADRLAVCFGNDLAVFTPRE